MTHNAPRRLRRSGATVPLIVGLFVGSAVLRIAAGSDAAFATDVGAVEEMQTDEAIPMACGPDDMPAALFSALQDREARVAAREIQIDNRMQALRVAEAELSEQIIALTEAEASLSALVTIADGAAENDIGRLTAVYENMKPGDAAALFEEMDPGFAAGFVGRMRPEAAAAVMTNLEPATAHLISVVLAGRNANAPTQ